MSESVTQQGQRLVRQLFNKIAAEYRDRFTIDKVFPWRGGNTIKESREEQVPAAFLIYYLPFEIDRKKYYIRFTRDQFDDCYADDLVRDQIERQIRQKFQSFIN